MMLIVPWTVKYDTLKSVAEANSQKQQKKDSYIFSILFI